MNLVLKLKPGTTVSQAHELCKNILPNEAIEDITLVPEGVP